MDTNKNFNKLVESGFTNQNAVGVMDKIIEQGKMKRDDEKTLDTTADATADSNDAVIGKIHNNISEPKPKKIDLIPKKRGVGFTRKDKTKNKKARLKMAKVSRKKNRKCK